MNVAEPNFRKLAELPSDMPLSTSRCLAIGLSLARQIRNRHEAGRWHGDIRLETIELAGGSDVRLQETGGARVFGGERCDLELCPPELPSPAEVRLSLDVREATQQLRKAGLSIDVRRIDVYQIGVVLCQLLTGGSIREYAESPRLKGNVPPDARELLDRTLGFDSPDRVQTGNALCDLLESTLQRLTLIEGLPADTPVQRQAAADTSGGEAPGRDSAVLASAHAELPCVRLAHFQLIKPIGNGGMGEVYLAHDEKLDRQVAVKILRQDLASDASFVGRFQTEVDVIKQLPHPNLLPLYFSGVEDGRRFYVMRYIDGPSLATRLRTAPLKLEEAIEIALQCLSALAVAHDEALIHRDIKPANVLLEAATGRAYLVDFGLARRVDESQGLTRTGIVVGSFQYLSPEQARGDQHIDCRADLYSFGVMLYQMLSGQLPFSADSEVGWIFQHVNELPPPLGTLAPDLPPELCALVGELLAKRPEDRPPTCRAVIERLQPLQEPAARTSQFVSELSLVLQQTETFDSPTFELPPSGMQGAWDRWRDNAATIIRRGTPAWVKRCQTDEQQIDAVIAQLQRRHRRLQSLQAEGYQLLRELRQRQPSDEPSGGRQLHDISEQVANVDLQAAQVKAQLLSLTSQRDALVARLRQAQRRASVAPRTAALGIFTAMLVLALGTGVFGYRSWNLTSPVLVKPDVNPPADFPPNPPKPPVAIPQLPPPPPPKTAPIQAEAAEAVLAIGGKLRVVTNGVEVRITNAAELPAAAYEVSIVSLNECSGVDQSLMSLLGQTPSIEEVHLLTTGVDDAELAPLKNLSKLRILGCGNSPATGSCLQEFSNLPSLQMIAFGGRFEGHNLQHFAKFPNLVHVFLGWTKLSDDDLQYVPELQKVRHVLLNRTEISGEGLQYLSRWSAIDTLSLSTTKITDAGLTHLPLLTKLKKLDLAENDVGDASVATLSRYPSLQSLNLKKTKFTANGLAQLKAALPGCVIEQD